jgi:hypothetical protein
VNQDVQEKWLAALRSGEYKQTGGYLTVTASNDDKVNPVGHCCLGVLCDLAVKAGVAVEAIERDTWDGISYKVYSDPDPDIADRSSAILPAVVAEWAGVSTSPCVLESPEDDFGVDLTDLNDARAWDFAQIADAIEGGLFEGRD